MAKTLTESPPKAAAIAETRGEEQWDRIDRLIHSLSSKCSDDELRSRIYKLQAEWKTYTPFVK